ncbi:class C beta-lactamase [Pseudomonas aeruginosa]|uniref:class C beta-lactamase n=1 Tax=Pseudomonas aeruginosa TaxID=287 RepID=UPI003969AA6A
MMMRCNKNVLSVVLLGALSLSAGNAFGQVSQADVDAVIRPLMSKYKIPGMAVALSVDGQHTFYNYGVASKATGQAVTPTTLFEIGSLSKTFTATLASYAQGQGKLQWSDQASHYLPSLKGSAFDRVTLLNLATHTSGMPLFVPDEVTNQEQLMAWYQAWQPTAPIGSQRVYSNLGIGMLGLITAQSLQKPFSEAMEQDLLAPLGMKHSWVKVPENQMAEYAQGYNKLDEPVRVTPGPPDAEAYGLKSSSADLLRWLDLNMAITPPSPAWQQAITETHKGYYQTGEFTQALIWEYYPWPTTKETLLAGNSSERIMKGLGAKPLTPAHRGQDTTFVGS